MINSLKNSGTRKRPRALWKPDDDVGSEVTVPLHLAFCGIAAALRHHVGLKTPTLAVLLVEAQNAMDSYAHAGRLFLSRQLGPGDYRDPFVRSINERKSGNPTDLQIFRRAAENGKGLLLCTNLDDVDEELRLFADVVKSIPKPTPHQITATFRLFGHVLTKAELQMIESESWTRLLYAFQPDRSVLAGLRRLRETAKRGQTRKLTQITGGAKLEDLHGFGEAAEWGLELARDLKDYRSGSVSWDEVDTGLLLSGAPGTGKTFFAQALANTCHLPIVTASAAQWQAAGYLNDLLKAMKATFAEAQARSPCLLYIDEIDSFGSRAIHDSHHMDYKRQVINGLLELLDGFNRRSRIIVIGATNDPQNLDPAITRAGRLDRHIVIELPDEEARLGIFTHYACLTVPNAEKTKFARSTVGFSGADIERMVRNARRIARRSNESFCIDHVFKAARPLTQIPSEHMRLAAIHETGHAIVGTKLGLHLEGITITDTIVTDCPDVLGGAVFSIPPLTLRTKSFYLNRLTTLVAGLAAEALVFGEFTDGGAVNAQSDLALATMLATKMEASLGFGDTIAIEIVDERELSRLRSINPALRLAVQKLMHGAFERATSLLRENTSTLQLVSEMLQARHYVPGSEIERILRGSSHKSGAN